MAMSFTEAKAKHCQQWLKGYRKPVIADYVFPYNVLYENDMFVIVDVPVSDCKLQETNEDIVNKYTGSETNIVEQAWGLAGKRLYDGSIMPFWHEKIYIVDGNHRTAAAIQRGQAIISIVLPSSNYEQYKRMTHEQNS